MRGMLSTRSDITHMLFGKSVGGCHWALTQDSTGMFSILWHQQLYFSAKSLLNSVSQVCCLGHIKTLVDCVLTHHTSPINGFSVAGLTSSHPQPPMLSKGLVHLLQGAPTAVRSFWGSSPLLLTSGAAACATLQNLMTSGSATATARGNSIFVSR